jgi:phage tail-like protein
MPDEPWIASKTFLVELEDGGFLGWFRSCSGLQAEYETYPYGEGGLNTFVHQLKGRMKYSNLVLSQGLVSGQGLLGWFNQSKERSERGTITLKLLNSELNVEQTWAFAAAWGVRYTGPDLEVEREGMAVESLEIAHEGLVPGVT